MLYQHLDAITKQMCCFGKRRDVFPSNEKFHSWHVAPGNMLTSSEAYLSVVPVCRKHVHNVLRLTAVLFIRIVSTVVEAITAPLQIETSATVTFELPRTATCTSGWTSCHQFTQLHVTTQPAACVTTRPVDL